MVPAFGLAITPHHHSKSWRIVGHIHMEQSQVIRYQLLLSLLITLLIAYWGYIRLIVIVRTNDDSISDDVDLKAQEEEDLFNEEF
jgi:hypothetical protein